MPFLNWGIRRLAPFLLLPSLLACAPPAPAASASASANVQVTPPIADLAVLTPQQGCAALGQVDLTGIGGAGSHVATVSEALRDGVAVCAVQGVLAPAIGFQVTLPLRSWTQRYLQIGCGGLCGRAGTMVGAADGCATLQAGGFVIAATDMGHQGNDSAFGRDPQQRADFAWRAQHLTALAAKQITAAFYGRGPAYSYFSGCSDGGREALMEAQRFPEDFDGIIAGAAALNFQLQNAIFHAWQARANTGADGKPILTAARLPVLHRAVLAQCDALDGQEDGLVSAPALCHVDPTLLLCPPGQRQGDNTCLTAAEAEVARKFYEGPRDPATGQRLTVGGPLPGSELAWAGVYVPVSAERPFTMSPMISLGVLRDLAFEVNPPAGFQLSDLRFDRATFDRLRPRHALYDATNPDLSAFAARGGKLILWHGLADPHISPLNSIAYHQALRGFLGEEKAEGFERLYLLPGVYHCSGGEGPSLLDLLTPMMAWVERGQAPDALVTRQAQPGQRNSFGQPGGMPGGPGGAPPAGPPPQGMAGGMMPPPPGRPSGMIHSGMMGQPPAGLPPQGAPDMAVAPDRTRPVYPYPFVAAHDGRRDVNSAASYHRGPPLGAVTLPDWLGAAFFRPYAFRDR
ncbi:tannase/feruloyl esterase family alpha/beta hydrolase [Roseomonas sp. GC11]|uniref:tannase/feruloyl esterase family alpha/beta hydrolase n=1 Tax=Roseomonas sp. GC11 TaxID=2950546 RepID=UPI00210B9390|nr:tannase/feruloyl esterase family alpha/beta hydrolase [Roseomonas sp. GC11]MCQ4159473.1 tannase/feruloyl esterase family alpha/beta hydrolase [Roseomonas sp. GC11]